MRQRQLKELEEQAELILSFLSSLEQTASDQEYCEAKRRLRILIDPATVPVLRRLLRDRGIEL